MVSLLDVNVLIALAWPNHVHHSAALRWFRGNQSEGWATCPVTQSGFVRVSSNRRVLPEARSPQEALQLLRRITELPGHQFWTDDIALVESDYVEGARLQGHRQVTDAHLLAVALRNKGRLATFDAGVRTIVPAAFAADDAVCLLTVSERGEA